MNDHHGRDLQETFVRHRDRLRAIALQIVGENALAEDVLQIAHESIGSASIQLSASEPQDYCVRLVTELSLVQKSLARLPPGTRQAFTLYRSQRLSRNQIASRLHVPVSHVDRMIDDAVAALKASRPRP